MISLIVHKGQHEHASSQEHWVIYRNKEIFAKIQPQVAQKKKKDYITNKRLIKLRFKQLEKPYMLDI